MSRYDGLIIPRSYNEYINKSDPLTLAQALQQNNVLSGAVAVGDNKAVKSGAVATALANALNQTLKSVTTDSTQLTIIAGGYVQIGNLVIVNIRFSVTEANTLITFNTNLPTSMIQNRHYIPCNIIDIQGDTYSECFGYKQNGTNGLVVKVPNANHDYALHCAYICA